MAHVYRVRTQGSKTFGEFANEYWKDIYKLPSINVMWVMKVPQSKIKSEISELKNYKRKKEIQQ